MREGTTIRLLLAATGIGILIYMIKQGAAANSGQAAPSIANPGTVPNVQTPPVATPPVPTPLQRNPDQVTAGVIIPPGVPQLSKEQAQAALNEAKRLSPWVNYDKKVGYLYANPEVIELQRLLGVEQIPGIFREQERDKLLQIKGIKSISLTDWYMTPNKIDFNVIK